MRALLVAWTCIAAAVTAGCVPNRMIRASSARIDAAADGRFVAGGYAHVEREAAPRAGAFDEDVSMDRPDLVAGMRLRAERTQFEAALSAPWLAGSAVIRQQLLAAERGAGIDAAVEVGVDGAAFFSLGGVRSGWAGVAVSRVVGAVEPYAAAAWHYGGVDQPYDVGDDMRTAHRHHRLLVLNLGVLRAAAPARRGGWRELLHPSGCEVFAAWAPDPRPHELEHRAIGLALIWH